MADLTLSPLPGKNPSGGFRKILWIVFEIAMIVVGLIFIFPALFVLINAFKSGPEINLQPLALPTSFYLDNFFKAWEQTKFPEVLFNTFLITSLSVLGIVFVSATAAYALVRATAQRTSWVIYSLFTFAMIIPFQVIMVPLVVLATDLNLTNIWGIIPMYWGLGCPLAIFMYHGFIKGVPISLEESAHLDGANIFEVFYKIVFPLLTPITATIIILDVLWIWNDFLLPLIIVKKGTLQLAQFAFFGMFFREYGLAMASLVLSASPVLIFYFFLQRFIIKGIAAGAVKG